MASLPIHPPTAPGLQTPAVTAALLKEIGKQLPGIVAGEPLAVGQVVTARIGADPAGGGPVLMIGGVRIHAQLPEGVASGQALRLQVKESSPERVLLQIVSGPDAASGPGDAAGVAAAAPQGPAQQAAAAAPPWAVIPMPGGAQARIWLDPEGSGDAEPETAPRTRSMVVRYDSPVLGRTDVVLRLDLEQLDATVLTSAGGPLELVRQSVPALRLALAGAVERSVAISTGGRVPEEFDIRA